MENASKALLIAAAVLIVVLLVAFGMRIFNQSQGAGDAQGTADSISQGITGATDKLQGEIVASKTLTKDEFNAQFKIGVKMTGTEAKTYGYAIKKTYKTVDGPKSISLIGVGPEGTTIFRFDWPDKEYVFEVREYDAQGYITELKCAYRGTV